MCHRGLQGRAAQDIGAAAIAATEACNAAPNFRSAVKTEPPRPNGKSLANTNRVFLVHGAQDLRRRAAGKLQRRGAVGRFADDARITAWDVYGRIQLLPCISCKSILTELRERVDCAGHAGWRILGVA
jgi:hypothetical protein